MEEYPVCFLCGRNGNGDPLEKHHIFGGALRKVSEKYGLVVNLCGERCHRNGPDSAHKSKETADYLHRYGQEKFMEENDCNIEQFRLIFRKNYL